MKLAPAALLAAWIASFAGTALAQGGQESVELETPTGTIRGTLWVPPGADRRPVVLIVAGSGPTDRDGNQPRLSNDSLKQLAAALASQGVASLRYDKRGVGASRAAGREEKDLRFEHYVEDAAAWLAWLKADPRFSLVGAIGHSEGAHIGALAAARSGVGAYVSIAGLGRKPAEVLRAQLKPKLPEPFWVQSERILAALERGQTDADVPKELMILYRPSVQPYLISWFRQSPTEAVAKLEIPVLVVQGTADVQVALPEAEALHAAAKNGTLLVVPDMSHVMKRATGDPASSMKGYTDPAMPIVPELAPRIVQFLRAAAGAGSRAPS